MKAIQSRKSCSSISAYLRDVDEMVRIEYWILCANLSISYFFDWFACFVSYWGRFSVISSSWCWFWIASRQARLISICCAKVLLNDPIEDFWFRILQSALYSFSIGCFSFVRSVARFVVHQIPRGDGPAEPRWDHAGHRGLRSGVCDWWDSGESQMRMRVRVSAVWWTHECEAIFLSGSHVLVSCRGLWWSLRRIVSICRMPLAPSLWSFSTTPVRLNEVKWFAKIDFSPFPIVFCDFAFFFLVLRWRVWLGRVQVSGDEDYLCH